MSDDASGSADPNRPPPGLRGPDAATRGARGARTISLHQSDAAGLRSRSLERRATRRALQDWLQLRRTAEMPSLVDLAPHRNPVDWADRFLLACDPEAARSVFVLCGERVETAFGKRLIGRALCDVAPERPALITACRDAVHERAPVEIEDAFRLASGRLVLYRAVFMPVRGLEVEDCYLMGAYGSFPVRD